MAAQANGAPSGPVTLTPDLLDPFNSPWRPAKDLSTPVETVAPGACSEPSMKPTPSAAARRAGRARWISTRVVAELEKKLIEAALETCRGHQKKAAEHLGLSYHQMRGLLRKYGYGREGAADEPLSPASRNAAPTDDD